MKTASMTEENKFTIPTSSPRPYVSPEENKMKFFKRVGTRLLHSY